MRTKLIVGNWKMNMTSTEGVALVEHFMHEADIRFDLDVAVCPPYLSIPAIKNLTQASAVKLGAQDCFWSDAGAFTGKVSAHQLFEFCVDFCLIGHSETRGKFGKLEIPESTVGYFAETEETINLKIKALLYHGITPILCVGETDAERQADQTDEVIKSQIKGAVDGIDPVELYSMVLAYEPVWAIGTGNVCDSVEAERVCGMIRSTIAEIAGEEIADIVRVLYGGSVKPDNAKELFSKPNIDGGLVGGASLDAKSFSSIVASV